MFYKIVGSFIIIISVVKDQRYWHWRLGGKFNKLICLFILLSPQKLQNLHPYCFVSNLVLPISLTINIFSLRWNQHPALWSALIGFAWASTDNYPWILSLREGDRERTRTGLDNIWNIKSLAVFLLIALCYYRFMHEFLSIFCLVIL